MPPHHTPRDERDEGDGFARKEGGSALDLSVDVVEYGLIVVRAIDLHTKSKSGLALDLYEARWLRDQLSEVLEEVEAQAEGED